MDEIKYRDHYEDFCLAFFMELRDKYHYRLSADQLLSFLKISDNIDLTDEESLMLNMQMFFCHQISEISHFKDIFHAFYHSDEGQEAIKQAGIKKRAGAVNKNVFLQKQRPGVTKTGITRESLPNFKCERFFAQYELINGICDYSSFIHAGFLNLYDDYIRYIEDIDDTEKNTIADTLHKELADFVSYCRKVLEDPSDFARKSQEVSSFFQVLASNQEDDTEDDDEEASVPEKDTTDFIPQNDNRIPLSSDFTKKDIRLLTKKDMEEIKKYIKENAHKLRGRVNRNLRKSGKSDFDPKKTVKDAFKTGMVPIYLSFKNPKPRKVRLVCLLDISPSCISAATVLMHLLHALETSFSGGVEIFSFTDGVKKITPMVRTHTIAECITKITTESKGTVSDYSSAFEYFNEQYSHEIRQNTIVLLLGDMRNNYRRFRKEGLVKLQTRVNAGSGKVVLLHTDPKRRWYKDDSILKTAEKNIDEIYEVKNVDDILHFLSVLEL